MPQISFFKFHGFGNDYLVIEERELRDLESIADFARAVCNRKTGVGSDGLAVIGRGYAEGSDFSCRIINPDGTEAGFSGNGTRCAVACLYYRRLWNEPELLLHTKSGIKKYEFLGRRENVFEYRAEIGNPRFSAEQIPFLPDAGAAGSDRAESDSVTDYPIKVSGKEMEVTCLNVGNPVCAVFVDEFDPGWRQAGKELESHRCFPARANVVFAKVLSPGEIEIRIWERGAGETDSSGTCSIGAAVAAAFSGRTERIVLVRSVGGVTKTAWRADDEMILEGSAAFVFEAAYNFG